MNDAGNDVIDPERQQQWRLDTSETLRGGLLGPDDTITDMAAYSLPQREELARANRAWGELVAIPAEIAFAFRYDAAQKRAMPHQERIAAEERRRREQEALERTAEWRDMLDLRPTIGRATPKRQPPNYPDGEMVREILGRIRTRLGDASPSQDAFQELMRVAFLASLTREESRPLCFALGMGPPPGDRDRAAWSGDPALVFVIPRPLEVRELNKLAPACDAGQGIIGVQVGTNGQLEMWGLLHTGSSVARVRRGQSAVMHFRNYPIVRVVGSGDLFVEIGPERIGEIRAGVTATDGFHVFFEDGPVFRYMRHYRIEEVLRPLLRRVLDLRHGGAVFLVPAGAKGHVTDICEVKKYRLAEYAVLPPDFLPHTPLLSGALESWRMAQPTGNERGPLAGFEEQRRQQARAALVDAIEMVAGLTAVDGALVLSTDLTVIGFGAVVKDIQATPPAFRALDVQGKEVEPFDLQHFGTRHRSASCFCMACPGSMAFVASQDGPLSCMVARTDIPGHTIAVFVWRPVEVERNFTVPGG